MSTHAKPIQVIAWFDDKGKINPIKFKLETEEEETKVIYINKILNSELEKLSGTPMWKFTCNSLIDGIEKNYKIKYDLLSSKWILFI
ncbi:MAG: hypothetical protein RR500_08505 [Bacilli bacterium]